MLAVLELCAPSKSAGGVRDQKCFAANLSLDRGGEMGRYDRGDQGFPSVQPYLSHTPAGYHSSLVGDHKRIPAVLCFCIFFFFFFPLVEGSVRLQCSKLVVIPDLGAHN